ncbi:heme-binding protein [Mycolicibacterium confluentis]|nr:heme-binding protein [Mycolicibacterium confluentis]
MLAAVGAAGLMALASAGTVNAAPSAEQCSPAAMMRAHAGAMTQMADYLDAHPDVQQVFTNARSQSTPEARREVIESYNDTHPDVATAMKNIHQPVQDLRTQCGLTKPGMDDDMGPGPMMSPGQ